MENYLYAVSYELYSQIYEAERVIRREIDDFGKAPKTFYRRLLGLYSLWYETRYRINQEKVGQIMTFYW